MDWQLVLEYLKVLLSVQMVTGIIIVVFLSIYNDEVKALLSRLIKLPGGVELSTPQLEKVKTEKPMTDKVSTEPQSTAPPVPAQDETFKKLYDAERARAYFWEYSYLNYFLVQSTQLVLDYLAGLTAPISVSLYDSLLTTRISEAVERKAILSALERHLLIAIEKDLITVTPKGREYIEWRVQVLGTPAVPKST